MSKNTSLTIGTRASPLAVRQSELVAHDLRAAHGLDNADIGISKITTKGDRALDTTLSELGGKGLFTEELEAGLKNGNFDMAVHSLKDLPTQNAEGLTLGAILPRANAADMLVLRDGVSANGLADLPQGAHIGTASLRRQAQLLRARPDAKISLLRGNIGTRLEKTRMPSNIGFAHNFVGGGRFGAFGYALKTWRRIDRGGNVAGGRAGRFGSAMPRR